MYTGYIKIRIKIIRQMKFVYKREIDNFETSKNPIKVFDTKVDFVDSIFL